MKNIDKIRKEVDAYIENAKAATNNRLTPQEYILLKVAALKVVLATSKREITEALEYQTAMETSDHLLARLKEITEYQIKCGLLPEAQVKKHIKANSVYTQSGHNAT